MSQEKKTLSEALVDFGQNLILGGISASISKTVVAPIERVKLLLQTRPSDYNGMIDCFAQTHAKDGIKGFWRGNGLNVARYFPTQALNFAFKDRIKQSIMPLGDKAYTGVDYTLRSMGAGGAAGAFSMLFVYPLDLARTRLSSDTGKVKQFKGPVDVIKQTAKEGGPLALYRGFGISVAGIIPYRAVYFGGYDTLKRIFLTEDRPSFWKKWGVSQFNTIIAQYITYPIDTVRRNQMTKGGSKNYSSVFACAKAIYAEKGALGFFKGAGANTIRATGGALCMVLYDEAQQALKDYKAEN